MKLNTMEGFLSSNKGHAIEPVWNLIYFMVMNPFLFLGKRNPFLFLGKPNPFLFLGKKKLAARRRPPFIL